MSKKNKMLLAILIISTIIVTIFSTSKYKTAVATSDKAKTAVPIITINSEPLNISLNPTNGEQSYLFEVANYTGNKESEVSMEYYIKISNSNNLPLKYELYNYDETEKLEIGDNLLSEEGTTESVSMPVSSGKQSAKYMLKIKWEQDEKNKIYNKEIDYVQVSVNSKQID